MAASVVTTTVTNSFLDRVYNVIATLVITASPATYTAGGIAMNLNQSDIKASRKPQSVQITGNHGFTYVYVPGSDNSAGLMRIYVQDGVSQNPLAELTDASAIPAGITADLITAEITYKGME